MAAEILTLDGPLDAVYARCRDVVRARGVIAYPTDTFYGLGADPRDPEAVKRIFAIKGREAGQPILLLLHDRSEVAAWASAVTPSAERLMERFWPGPLTLVFPAAPHVLPELTGGSGTIGLRVPGNELTRELLRNLGTALTGTSANRSGGRNPRTAEEVMREVGDRVDLVLDGGATTGDRPSTVVDVTVEPPRIIRQGNIDIAASA
ncbi:MAG: threonylcarbamoyl-AMP synthase [Nitrospirae bacterium]|nr:threonylcarbamoyl-AMP synthase [Nitrospirota bacterium]NTW65228.1 threonylcarbamoyl-AMP synthase [Nitrospirota bacterium]